MITIRQAATRDDLDIAERLFRELIVNEYAPLFPRDVTKRPKHKRPDPPLPGEYASPEGGILLGFLEDEAVGCVAFRPFEDTICEMKRLYVQRGYRGQGYGRMLARAVIRLAAEAGYRKMRLVTFPQLENAVCLYRSLGFEVIPPYCDIPIADVEMMFMELCLSGAEQAAK